MSNPKVDYPDQVAYWKSRFSVLKPQSLFYKQHNFRKNNVTTTVHELDDKIVDKLIDISGKNDILEYCFFIAVVKILLYKFTGHKQITTVIPAYEGSSRAANTSSLLYLINEINSSLVFRGLILDVKNTISKAYQK